MRASLLHPGTRQTGTGAGDDSDEQVGFMRDVSDEQRFALGDALERAVPGFIQRCGANPELRYKDALPDHVKMML